MTNRSLPKTVMLCIVISMLVLLPYNTIAQANPGTYSSGMPTLSISINPVATNTKDLITATAPGISTVSAFDTTDGLQVFQTLFVTSSGSISNSCNGFSVSESAYSTSTNAICIWTGGQLALSAGGGSTGYVSWKITNTISGTVVDSGHTTDWCLTYQNTISEPPGTYNVFITSGAGSGTCSSLVDAEVVLNGIYPISSQLSIAATKLIPGTSTYISEVVYNASCTDATLIELSAPGGSCAAPDKLTTTLTTSSSPTNVLCNEAISTGGFAQNPYPPCLFDTANVAMPASAQGWSPTYCNMTYITNDTLPQGVYDVCGFYQGTNEGPPPQTPAGPSWSAIGSINITGADQPGMLQMQNPSSGWKLSGACYSTTRGKGIKGCILNPIPDTSTKSPFWWYWYLQGDLTPPVSGACNGPCVYPSAPNLYLEAAGGSTAAGCVSPLGPNGNVVSLPSCGNVAGAAGLPCLIESETLGGWAVPSWIPTTTGNYAFCLYNYTSPLQMGSNYGYPNGDGWSVGTPPYAYSTANTALFFASVNAQCNGSTCLFGTSNEEFPTVISSTNTLLGSASGTITVFNGMQPDQNGNYDPSTITANIDEALNYPANVYFLPIGQNAQIGNLQSMCSDVTQSSGKACTGTSADGGKGGCLVSYTPQLNGAWTPVRQGSSTIGCSIAISGYPQYGDSCTATWTTASGAPPPAGSGLAANTYLLCEMYQNTFVAGSVFVVGPPFTIGSSGTNFGNAVVAPLSGELCSIYSTINGIIFLIGLMLAIIGAILYESSSIFPSQQRGTLQGYAIGMVIGGIVGVAIAAVSVYAVSQIANIPIANLLGACPAVS